MCYLSHFSFKNIQRLYRISLFTLLTALLFTLGACGSKDDKDDDGQADEIVDVVEVNFSASIESAFINEGEEALVYIQLSQALTSDTELNIEVSGNVGSNDYESLSAMSIPAGETDYQFQIQTLTDDLYEGVELIQIAIDASHSGDESLNENHQELAINLIDLNEAPSITIDAIKDVVGVEDTIDILVIADGLVERDYSVAVNAIYTDGTTGNTLNLSEELLFSSEDHEKIVSFDLSQHPVSAASEINAQVVAADDNRYQLGAKTDEVLYIIDQVAASVYKGSPFGVAPSHASANFVTWWQDPIRQSGIDWIRGFDKRPETSRLHLENATNLGFSLTGILRWSAGDGFPDEDIEGWKAYVLDTIKNADPIVKQWEVWNEPPNFSEDKDPAHYAAIVRAAYEVVKEYDETMAVGLATSGMYLAFMDQALINGAVDHFDYVTIHPYPTARHMTDDGYDAQYMAMVSSIKRMLQHRNPEKTHVPVVITEVGLPLLTGGESVGDLAPAEKEALLKRQGLMAFKGYVLSLAQGIARIHWFQPLDNEGQSYGLIEGTKDNWTPRPAYIAIKTLIEAIGHNPHFIGWLPLDDDHTAYIFKNGEQYLSITWALPNADSQPEFELGENKVFINGLTGESTNSDTLLLGDEPQIMLNPSKEWINSARVHKNQPFLWQGDYTDVKEVSVTPSEPKGLHVGTSIVEADGELVFDAGQGVNVRFTVDQNFLNYHAETIRISVEAKVKGDHADPELPNPGFTLRYESPTGWKNIPGWNFIPKNGEWNTMTWEINDPMFVGRWAYHFNFNSNRTENSQYYFRKVTVEKLNHPN